MVYLLFGLQELMIKKQEKKIINSFVGESDYNLIRVKKDEMTLFNIIDEANQISLTNDKKIIIYFNPYFLIESKKSDFQKNVIDNFKDYLNNENENVLIIFECLVDNINSSNPLVKLINEKGKLIKLENIKNYEWNKYATKYFQSKNINISDDAINEIVIRCKNDLNLFENEVQKLLLFKSNNIDLDDVKRIVTSQPENDIFELVNVLVSNKKDKAIQYFRDLINYYDVVTLINTITTSLIFMDQVVLMNKNGFNSGEIAKELNCHPYRVQINLKNGLKIGENNINRNLLSLYELDYKIKHSLIDQKFGFELFLLNF